MKSVAQVPEVVQTDPTDIEVNRFPSARSPDANAVTADRGIYLCNRPDYRVSRSGRFSEIFEVLVAGPDTAYGISNFL